MGQEVSSAPRTAWRRREPVAAAIGTSDPSCARSSWKPWEAENVSLLVSPAEYEAMGLTEYEAPGPAECEAPAGVSAELLGDAPQE